MPVFGIHPANGEVYFYHKLAPLLGPGHPGSGLRARGLDGKTAAITRIDEMAAAYRREIVMVQPHGPYVIVGRCAGSRVAYELAQQLRHAREEVALLCLIDPGPLPGPTSLAHRLDELGQYLRYHAARGNLRKAVVRSATPRLRRVRARLNTVLDIALRRRTPEPPGASPPWASCTTGCSPLSTASCRTRDACCSSPRPTLSGTSTRARAGDTWQPSTSFACPATTAPSRRPRACRSWVSIFAVRSMRLPP